MAINVARIYEHTIRPGRSYCRICLRSAGETTLVTPKSVLQFTDALKLNIFDGKKVRSVCYICEAYAGTALRLYQACVNAVSIKTVCQPLKNMTANDPVPEWVRKAILGCNANLKEYWQKTTMQHTEVLVVDSSGVEWLPEEGTTCNEPTRIVAPAMPIKPTEPQEQFVTVVLDDDEDDAPAQNQIAQVTPPSADTLPKLVPIESLLNPKHKDKKDKTNYATFLPEQMRIISRHNVETNNFILHPVAIGEDGNLIAPSLAGQIVNGQLVFNANLYQPMPMVDCTEMSYIVHGTNLLQTNVVQSNTVPLSNSQSTNEPEEILPDNKNKKARTRIYGTEKYIKKGVMTDDNANKKRTSEDIDCVKKQKTQYILDLNTVNTIISNSGEEPIVISNVTSNSEDPIAVISNVTSASDSEMGGIGVIKEVVSRAPRLIEKNDKIDWEDKIPMDVISFVDSSDPFDRELIVPDRLPPQQHHQQQQQQQQQQTTTQQENVRPVRFEKNTSQVIDLC